MEAAGPSLPQEKVYHGLKSWLHALAKRSTFVKAIGGALRINTQSSHKRMTHAKRHQSRLGSEIHFPRDEQARSIQTESQVPSEGLNERGSEGFTRKQ